MLWDCKSRDGTACALQLSHQMPWDCHCRTASRRLCGQAFSQIVKPSPERAGGWQGDCPANERQGNTVRLSPSPVVLPQPASSESEGQAFRASAPAYQPPGLLQPALLGAPSPPPLSWRRCSLLREPPPPPSLCLKHAPVTFPHSPLSLFSEL